MNQLTQLYQYIKTLAEADDFINTIMKVDFNDIDLKKEIIFPLLNVRIITGSFTNGQTINFNVQIGVFDIRDINKEIKTDEFWGQDNEVDNHNLAIAVLNRLWSNMLRDFEDNNITASENPSFELGFFERAKLLDGVILSFDVEVPNTTISLCDGDFTPYNPCALLQIDYDELLTNYNNLIIENNDLTDTYNDLVISNNNLISLVSSNDTLIDTINGEVI